GSDGEPAPPPTRDPGGAGGPADDRRGGCDPEMTEPLLRALNRMRSHLLDPDALVRAVASGRQKGAEPRWRRAELRYVDLRTGRHLQVTTYDETQAHTANHAGDAAREAVDELLDEPFRNWHVETT